MKIYVITSLVSQWDDKAQCYVELVTSSYEKATSYLDSIYESFQEDYCLSDDDLEEFNIHKWDGCISFYRERDNFYIKYEITEKECEQE